MIRSRLGQAQELVSPQTETRRGNGRSATKEIPYDYVATFTLTGRAGNRVQDVINVSVEGAFVAVSIGYSVITRPDDLLQLASRPPGNVISFQLGSTSFGELAQFLGFLSTERPLATGQSQAIVSSRTVLQCLVAHVCGVHFRYSIVDSATGRELQNKPIHNIAGLGEPTGGRPFRPLPKPMTFMPRSTIRIEVEEVSDGLLYSGAELYIVLHGYKMLGYGTGIL
jgi:hypothetical protein